MHNSSHHIQSKRQSAPIKNPLLSCQSAIILSIPPVMLNGILVILSEAKNLPALVMLSDTLVMSLALVMLNLTLIMLSPPLVILSKAKNLPSPISIPIEVSTGNVLRTRLRFEQRLSRND